MRLCKDKSTLLVNDSLTLTSIPEACFSYRLGIQIDADMK